MILVIVSMSGVACCERRGSGAEHKLSTVERRSRYEVVLWGS